MQSWTTASDIALIKSAGFDHVRLSVNPKPMMDAMQRQDGGAEYFGYLDAAMKMILDAGLAVELDMHPDSDFKERLAKEDDFVQRFADFWSTVAQHYASWDADRVFFEILNEPEMRDAYRWYGVEAKLAAAIRRGAPANTIIATGARWDDDDDLVFLEPLPDTNVVYVFPLLRAAYLHASGCDLGSVLLAMAEGLALSVVAGECGAGCEARSRGARSDASDPLRAGSLGCRRASRRRSIRRPTGRKQRGVPLVCNEFGVFRYFSDPQDRAALAHGCANVARAPQHRVGDVGLFRQLRRGHEPGDEGEAG